MNTGEYRGSNAFQFHSSQTQAFDHSKEGTGDTAQLQWVDEKYQQINQVSRLPHAVQNKQHDHQS